MHVDTKQGDDVLTAGEQIEEVGEFMCLGSIVSKKWGAEEDIHAETDIEVGITNNQDQVEGFWVKCEGPALV